MGNLLDQCDQCVHNQTNPEACSKCKQEIMQNKFNPYFKQDRTVIADNPMYKHTLEHRNPKIIEGKLKLTSVLPELIEQIADIRMRGDAKYGTDSWRNVPREQWIDGMFRHLLELVKGNTTNDKDWGHHHAAHIACGAMFILDIDKNKGEQK